MTAAAQFVGPERVAEIREVLEDITQAVTPIVRGALLALVASHEALWQERTEREELLAHATKFEFDGFVALRIVKAPPAEREVWRVRDPEGFDAATFSVAESREEALTLARELATRAKGATSP